MRRKSNSSSRRRRRRRRRRRSLSIAVEQGDASNESGPRDGPGKGVYVMAWDSLCVPVGRGREDEGTHCLPVSSAR